MLLSSRRRVHWRQLAAVAILIAAPVLTGAAAIHPRPAKAYQLTPRRIEQRIDARGHDRLSLRATGAPPTFQVTVRFLDPETNRPLSVVSVPTDGTSTVTVGAPLPIFRVQLRASEQRDFQLTLTLL
jgi:hypothetical protein